MGIISTVVAFIASLFSVVTQPTALERFSEKDQQKIRDAAPDFVIAGGKFWDRSVDRRQREAKSKKGISEREAQALGISKTDPCDAVPRWHDAVGGMSLTTDREILTVTRKNSAKFEQYVGSYECKYIMQDGVAYVVRAEHTPGYGPKTREEVLPSPVFLKGHSLKKTGDHQQISFLVNTGEVRQSATGTWPVYRIASLSELDQDVQPVDPELLAQAIIDGKARFTEWRWDRKTETLPVTMSRPKPVEKITITWISKDITPKPLPDGQAKP
jgi:hypothetical protein